MDWVVDRVTLLLVWEIKAWIKTATHDARLCMLNPASNAVNLSPSWAASFDSVIWFRGSYLGGLFFRVLKVVISSSLSLTFHVEF